MALGLVLTIDEIDQGTEDRGHAEQCGLALISRFWTAKKECPDERDPDKYCDENHGVVTRLRTAGTQAALMRLKVSVAAATSSGPRAEYLSG